METLPLGLQSLKRTLRAVELVKSRLLRATAALESARIAYAVVVSRGQELCAARERCAGRSGVSSKQGPVSPRGDVPDDESPVETDPDQRSSALSQPPARDKLCRFAEVERLFRTQPIAKFASIQQIAKKRALYRVRDASRVGPSGQG
jgi:hypothetical protein